MVEIYKFQQEHLFIAISDISSYFIRLRQLGDLWLFNCCEGCQHRLAKHKIKMSQIKKIIITYNSIKNISGLLGLLSSMSLSTVNQRLDIYAPKSLHKYIFLCRKYSQTSFRYTLYLHTVLDGLIYSQDNLNMYALYRPKTLKVTHYIFLLFEDPGPFYSLNAINYQIPFGPLYGFLKSGDSFITPDGFSIYNRNFIVGYQLGVKLLFSPKLIQNKKSCFLNNYTFLLFYT